MQTLPVVVQIRYLIDAPLLCFTVAAVGFHMWKQTPLNKDQQPGLNCTCGYTGSAIAGVMMLFSCGGFRSYCSTRARSSLLATPSTPNTRAEAKRLLHMALGTQVLFVLFFMVLGFVMLFGLGSETASCGITFCFGVEGYSPFAKTRGARFNFLIAFMAFCTLIPLSCLTRNRIFTRWQLQKAAPPAPEKLADRTTGK